MTNQYWTYIHNGQLGKTVIKRAVHANFNSPVTNFTTIITGATVGDVNAGVESPGFCTNGFLSAGITSSYIKNVYLNIYPNPADGETEINAPINAEIEIINLQGQRLKHYIAKNEKTIIDLTKLPESIFIVKVKTANGVIIKKLVKNASLR